MKPELSDLLLQKELADCLPTKHTGAEKLWRRTVARIGRI